MCLLFAVLFQVLMSGSVQTASCSSQTGNTCMATTWTSNTCSNNVCVCKEGFPIHTGCSKKLDKPTVTLPDSTRASIVDMHMNVTLVCSTNIRDGDGISFEWRKNDELLLNATESEYTVFVTSVNDTGLYTCRIKYGNYNASDESNPLDMKLWSDDSNLTLSISGVPTEAASGSTYNVTCSGLPVGKEPTFRINDTLTTNPMEADNAGNITCVYLNFTSPSQWTPSIVNDIHNVKIIVDDTKAADYVYKPGTNVTLQCGTVPDEAYMNVGNATIEYTFEDVLNTTYKRTVNSQTYTLDSTRNHTVRCSAAYNKKQAKMSPEIKFTFSDFYIMPPVLRASASQLLEGSRVVLRCTSSDTSVFYTWAKDKVAILFQHDQVIQIDGFKATDVGDYSCSIKKKDYSTESNAVKLSLATSLSKPRIVSDKDTGYYQGENYTLECQSTSTTEGMVYTWKKNNVIIPGTTGRTFNLLSVTSNANGDYTCETKFNTEAVSSLNLTISIGLQIVGRRCTLDNASNVCKGDEYTSKCIQKPLYRCECKPGYKEIKDACQKASVVLCSVVLVMTAAILSRLI